MVRERERERKLKTSWKVTTILKYFHLVANRKHRKQHIFKLEQEDGVIVGDC